MPIHRHHLMPNVKQVIRDRDFAMLCTLVKDWRPIDFAQVLSEMPPSEQALVLRHVPRELSAAVFQYLLPSAQQRVLGTLANEEVAEILNSMPHDDLTQLLEVLSASTSRQLLNLIVPERRAVAQSLLEYPDGSIGRLMTPAFVAVVQSWTVRQVLDHIREQGRDKETLNVVYITDPNGVLLDDIRIREFLLAPLDGPVTALMDGKFVSLRAADPKEVAVNVFKREDRTVLPVTDQQGVLLGIVTVDDVLDVAVEGATRDIHMMGGLEALEEPYLQMALGRMVKKRAGWLVLLFLGEMMTATAMGYFEKEIARAVVLALFIPLVISSGGNSGSQASTLVIRALALGEVQLSDWGRILRREMLSGLALGSVLGSIGFLRVTLWSAFSDLYGPHWFLVALTVAGALVGVVLWGTLAGSLLPFLLHRLGFDPATSSAPFVATLVDVTGLVIYFSVAAIVLQGTLL